MAVIGVFIIPKSTVRNSNGASHNFCYNKNDHTDNGFDILALFHQKCSYCPGITSLTYRYVCIMDDIDKGRPLSDFNFLKFECLFCQKLFLQYTTLSKCRLRNDLLAHLMNCIKSSHQKIC